MNLNVLYFFSDSFVEVAATSIVSLLENNKAFSHITIYVIDDGISKEKREMLRGMINSYGRELVLFPAPDPSAFFNFSFKSRYQMGHSYMRMCIGQLVPETVDKILCLDSDTLVLGNLQKFWNLDLGDNIMAGVADCVNVRAFKRQFMLSQNQMYCNAGMFLIDMNKWRNEGVETKIKEVIQEHNGNIFFFEQTLMNYVCRDRILRLTPEFNSYTLFYAFKFKNLIIWRRPTNFYSKEEVEKAVKNPQIIHFTRNFYMLSRPWVRGCDHPLTSKYLEYKKMTPWNELSEDNRSFSKKVRYRFIHLLPQTLLAYIVYVLYNLIRPLLTWKNE